MRPTCMRPHSVRCPSIAQPLLSMPYNAVENRGLLTWVARSGKTSGPGWIASELEPPFVWPLTIKPILLLLLLYKHPQSNILSHTFVNMLQNIYTYIYLEIFQLRQRCYVNCIKLVSIQWTAHWAHIFLQHGMGSYLVMLVILAHKFKASCAN